MTANREVYKERLREASKKFKDNPEWWDLVLSAGLASDKGFNLSVKAELAKEVLKEAKLEKLIGIRQ